MVGMNVIDYDSKLHELVSDPSKFTPCDANQSDKVNVKINKIANNLKISHPAHFIKLEEAITTMATCMDYLKSTKS